MDRKAVRDLLLFVNETNGHKVMEAVNSLELSLTEEQLRVLVNAITENTNQCFYRIMEKM